VEYKVNFDYSLFPYPYLLQRLTKAYHESIFPSTERKPRAKRKKKEKQIILDLGGN